MKKGLIDKMKFFELKEEMERGILIFNEH